MSKHNKKKDNNKKRPEPISVTSMNKIFEPAVGIIKDAPKDIEVENPPKVDEIKASIESLAGSEAKFSEDDKSSFKQLMSNLKDAIEAYKQAKNSADAKSTDADNRSKQLDDKVSELTSRESNLEARKNSLDEREELVKSRENSVSDTENKLKQRETDVSIRESDVSRREAEADAGFCAKEMAWKKEATDKFNAEIQSIRDELDNDKANNLKIRSQLVKDQEKCLQEQASYASKKEALKETEERLTREHEDAIEEIRDEHNRILDGYKDDFKQQIENLKKRNGELQNQISQFNDIRAELGGHSASEINEIISGLKTEVARLNLDIQNVGSAEFQQKLEAQAQLYKDECESLTAEKNGLKTKLLQLRKKVLDVDGLKALNKTLETHNRALAEAQSQLQNKLDELTSKDNNKEIFAELKGIDARCATPYNRFTTSDGDLKSFVNAVGYQLTQYTPNLFYTPETLQLFVGGLAMSRLILLQGISGTGKTKLAQAFSSIVGDNLDGTNHDDQERCSCIVPVQAGWRDNQDLLGYYNAFEKKFYEKPFSKGLYTASTPAFKERLFFLILDEMNLSHPEQYFADFISAMEQANSVSDSFEVDLLSGIPDEVMGDEKRWPLSLHREKIVVPPNVWFIGTANHDETTMEFADKTYDRAHVMVMDRNTQRFNYGKVRKGAAHWSASDLRDAFRNAQNSMDGKNHADWVKTQLDSLKDILKKEFDVSFGNRLERQIENFVPVVCAAGGTKELALDHLIATKIIRRGKITGLFGVQKESLENLREEILSGIGLTETSQTIRLLNQDIASKERGA